MKGTLKLDVAVLHMRVQARAYVIARMTCDSRYEESSNQCLMIAEAGSDVCTECVCVSAAKS